MIANLWMAFDDRAQSAANPREDEPVSSAYRALGDPLVRSLFRQDDPPGPRSYELWSMYYEVDTEGQVRDVRNDLLAEYPGQLRTVGSWWNDGRQIGTEYVFADVTRDVEIDDPDVDPPMIDDPDRLDEDPIPQIVDPDFAWPQITIQVTGPEIVGTSGQAIFPLNAGILDFMPDIVTYDDNGNETSRVRPTVATDVNLGMGQTPRVFT